MRKGTTNVLTDRFLSCYMFVTENRNKTTNLKPIIMKLKAVLFSAAIFGATFFVTSTTDNDNNKDEIQKQAVDRRLIKVPTNG